MVSFASRINHFAEKHLLPVSISCTDNTIRTSRESPESPLFLCSISSLCLFFSVVPCRVPLERIPCRPIRVHYALIECPDHGLGTRASIRSGRSIILSPRNRASLLGNLIGRLGKKSMKSSHEGYV